MPASTKEPSWAQEGGQECPPYTILASAYRTNSAAARRTSPAAAYAHTAYAIAQPGMPSYFAGREQYPDPLPREHSPGLHPELLPSTPRRAFPPARSVAAPDLPTAEASRCPRSIPPSHAAKLLLPVPLLQSRIPPARATSPFRACRRSPARTSQSELLQIQAPAELSLLQSHLRPLLSYLRLQLRRPASSTPGYSPSSISTDADRICQRLHPPHGARLLKERQHSSKSRSEPNRASRATNESPAAADSALRFP